MNRESYIPLYMDYIGSGGVISPMHTESCRRYLQEKTGIDVEPEDVLWLFYHIKKGGDYHAKGNRKCSVKNNTGDGKK